MDGVRSSDGSGSGSGGPRGKGPCVRAWDYCRGGRARQLNVWRRQGRHAQYDTNTQAGTQARRQGRWAQRRAEHSTAEQSRAGSLQAGWLAGWLALALAAQARHHDGRRSRMLDQMQADAADAAALADGHWTTRASRGARTQKGERERDEMR